MKQLYVRAMESFCDLCPVDRFNVKCQQASGGNSCDLHYVLIASRVDKEDQN